MLQAALGLLAAIVATQTTLPRAPAELPDSVAPQVDLGTLPNVTGVRILNAQSGNEQFFFHVVSIVTGTGFPEKFLLHAPTQMPATPQPLVVIFHQFGASHLDVLTDTAFVQAAHEKGWYLVSPLGGSKKHMSSIPSQLNTEIVLNWMLTQPAFNIDNDRLYAIGFSMGGGAALNFAARHKDPGEPRFAAVVNHTGTVSNINAYADDCVYFACTGQFVWDFWFGDSTPGSAQLWPMARSSVLDYDDATLVVDESRAFARNLLDGTAIQIIRGDMDNQVPYLIEQTDVFHAYMLAKGKVPGVDYDYFVQPYSTHDWGLLDEGAVLDWLAPHTLQTPNGGDTLIDGDGVYYFFDVVQTSAGAFTSFEWGVNVNTNTVSILETENLGRITVDTIRANLDTGSDLRVNVSTNDGLPDVVRLRVYATPPTTVLRDGVVDTSWVHDPLMGTLEFTEVDGGAHTWIVQP